MQNCFFWEEGLVAKMRRRNYDFQTVGFCYGTQLHNVCTPETKTTEGVIELQPRSPDIFRSALFVYEIWLPKVYCSFAVKTSAIGSQTIYFKVHVSLNMTDVEKRPLYHGPDRSTVSSTTVDVDCSRKRRVTIKIGTTIHEDLTCATFD